MEGSGVVGGGGGWVGGCWGGVMVEESGLLIGMVKLSELHTLVI